MARQFDLYQIDDTGDKSVKPFGKILLSVCSTLHVVPLLPISPMHIWLAA